MAVEDTSGARVFPSWQGLLEAAADAIEAEKRPEHTVVRSMLSQPSPDYMQCASWAHRGLGTLWTRFLEQRFSVSRDRVDPESLKLGRGVWKLGSTLVITTNYDRVLRWACDDAADLDEWQIEAPPGHLDALKGRLTRPTLWHLHGSVTNPATIILSPDGYQQFYTEADQESSHRAALATLRSLMATRHLIFIGFSLDDVFLVKQLEWVRDTFKGCGGPHYVLTPSSDVDVMRKKVDGLGVDLVEFEAFGAPLVAKMDELAACRESGASPTRSSPVTRESPQGEELRQRRERAIEQQLDDAVQRRVRLQSAGFVTADVNREIVELKRERRRAGFLSAGSVLGDRFLLIKEQGRGGFACVWEAMDQSTKDRVALKILHPQYAGDATVVERFFRGARAMAELEHPSVVGILEPRLLDGEHRFFTMKLVDGSNLEQAVIRREFDEARILNMLVQIASALGHAHERGYVHRDVKPTNILVDASGTPFLTDFDMVWIDDTTGGTRTGALGSFLYAAPEVMQDPETTRPTADVYGLGMTLLFCLLGQRLPLEYIRNIESTIQTLACRPELRVIVSRATHLRANYRYENGREFEEALRNAREESAPLITSTPVEGLSLIWMQDRERHTSFLSDGGAIVLETPGMHVASSTDVWGIRYWTRDIIALERDDDGEPKQGGDREVMTLEDPYLVQAASGRALALGGAGPYQNSQNPGLVLFDRRFHLLGSVGRYVFVASDDSILQFMAAHGHDEWDFQIIDLEHEISMTLDQFFTGAEMEELDHGPRQQAEKMFAALDSTWDDKKAVLTTATPEYDPQGRMKLRCQFTRETYYSNSDGRWDSYTHSVSVLCDLVPEKLGPYRELPADIARFWQQRGGIPPGRWGWSVLARVDAHFRWVEQMSANE